MALVLHVDKAGWRGAIRELKADWPGLIPVAKGNGYGQGIERLAQVAAEEGFDCLAVGTAREALAAFAHFDGDIMVLTPWDPRTVHGYSPLNLPAPGTPARALLDSGRLIWTVSDVVALDRLEDLGTERVVLELRTPLRRFGIGPEDYRAAKELLAGRPIEALTLHLPLASPGYEPVAQTVFRALEAGLEAPAIHVSHLTAHQCAQLAEETGLPVRARVGTELWIGNGAALEVTGTVRAVHAVARGQRVGYRLARVPGQGHVIVVDGGTAHGVGLEAPVLGAGVGRRAKRLGAAGAAAGAGYVPSAFYLDGRRLRYADTPHAQVAMLFVPSGWRIPAVGEDLPVRVRHTILRADAVVEE
jgi:alanine racemase